MIRSQYTLQTELRNGTVYVELLLTRDNTSDPIDKTFRTMDEARDAIRGAFGTAGEWFSLQPRLRRYYTVTTTMMDLMQFGFPQHWVQKARPLPADSAGST